MNVLVTGGAGFIGSYLAKRLTGEGCTVTVLDCFLPQVHAQQPEELPNVDRLIRADVRDRSALARTLEGQDVVVHLAALTGTGQSMYEPAEYESVNGYGTALLMELLAEPAGRTVRKVVVASSRAVYGEGAYLSLSHGLVYPNARTVEAMANGQFEPVCPMSDAICTPLPTPESGRLDPASLYGLTKLNQERTVLMLAKAYGLSAFALRYQNVYGPGQSLKNPYTGILAIFSGLARQNKPIDIFEDGQESRDFVYVEDVVEATWRCIRPEATGTAVFNVGSGERVSVLEVARSIVEYFESRSPIRVTGAFRVGDIRHNLADLTAISAATGYRPQVAFRDGLTRFLAWAEQEGAEDSGYQRSLDELRAKGLFVEGS